MDAIFATRNVCEDDDFKVDFEIIPVTQKPSELELKKATIQSAISNVDAQLAVLENTLEELNSEIDSLTNHADGVDYAIAVTCGILTGMFDAIIVGEWDFKTAKAVSNKTINEKVMNFAKQDSEYQNFVANKRTNNDPNRLDNAIEFLEKKYKLPGDGAYKNYKTMGVTDASHHLDDFCHHPTLVGLACCILVQFTGSATYRSSTGTVIKTPIEINEYGKVVSNDTFGKFFAGVVNWFFNVAQTMENRKGHLFSDMAGSSTSVGKRNEGAGLPGSFLSIAKELSALPCVQDTNFAENLRKAYQNGIGSGKSQLDFGAFNSLFQGASSKVDMRTEMAVVGELKRQAIPVIINELLVRGLYFVRRFIMQMREKQSLSELNWKEVIPVGNRTIARMMTIATGTFVTVDMADAAIRSAIKSGGITNPMFLSNVILRVNFVGVGRFAIAVGTDVGIEIKKASVERNRRDVVGEIISLTNVKLYYMNADLMCDYSTLFEKEAEMHAAETNMWIEVKKTQESVEQLYCQIENVGKFFASTISKMDKNFDEIEKLLPEVEMMNPGLIDEMFGRLSR